MTKASAKNALNGDSAKRGGGGVATTVVMGPGAIPIAASTAGGPLNGGGAGGGGGPPGKAAALEVMTRGAAVRAARDALQVRAPLLDPCVTWAPCRRDVTQACVRFW